MRQTLKLKSGIMIFSLSIAVLVTSGCASSTDVDVIDAKPTAAVTPTVERGASSTIESDESGFMPVEPGIGFMADYRLDSDRWIVLKSEPSKRILAEDGSLVLARQLRVEFHRSGENHPSVTTWSLDVSNRVIRQDQECGYEGKTHVCVSYSMSGVLPPYGIDYLSEFADGSAEFFWHGLPRSFEATVDVNDDKVEINIPPPEEYSLAYHTPTSLVFNTTGPVPLVIGWPQYAYELTSFKRTLPSQAAEQFSVRSSGVARGLALPPGSDVPLGESGRSIQEALDAVLAEPAAEAAYRNGCLVSMNAELRPSFSSSVGGLVYEKHYVFTFSFRDEAGRNTAWSVVYHTIGTEEYSIGRWRNPESVPARNEGVKYSCEQMALAPAAELSVSDFLEKANAILGYECCSADGFIYFRSALSTKGNPPGAGYVLFGPSEKGFMSLVSSVVVSADSGVLAELFLTQGALKELER